MPGCPIYNAAISILQCRNFKFAKKIPHFGEGPQYSINEEIPRFDEGPQRLFP